ncbi:MAG: RDD family protein [Acidimicrobiales bacterium]
MSDVPPPPPPPPPPSYGAPGGGAPIAGPPQADMGKRVVAGLIDLVGIPIGIYIVSFVLGQIAGILGLLGLLAQLGYVWVYLPYSEGTTGTTIGKNTQGIKTVSIETGQPVGFAMAWVRYFVNGIVCGLGWLLPLVDAQKQTLGDKVSKGVTVPA